MQHRNLEEAKNTQKKEYVGVAELNIEVMGNAGYKIAIPTKRKRRRGAKFNPWVAIETRTMR